MMSLKNGRELRYHLSIRWFLKKDVTPLLKISDSTRDNQHESMVMISGVVVILLDNDE
jgi:hypothetical protein